MSKLVWQLHASRHRAARTGGVKRGPADSLLRISRFFKANRRSKTFVLSISPDRSNMTCISQDTLSSDRSGF